MSKRLTIKYPDSLPDLLQKSQEEFESEARMAMVIKLFELGKITSGMAAKICGMDRVSFLLQLHRYNISAINYDDSELKTDIKNA